MLLDSPADARRQSVISLTCVSGRSAHAFSSGMKGALGFAVVTAATAAAMYFGLTAFTSSGDAPAAVVVHQTSPSAAEFARDLADTANQYGAEHAAKARITHTHCVQAVRGRYMCSYAIVRAHGASECHLIQARWTPHAASTFTVTLSGRVGRCGSLREALDSMG
jgi:hypothetical protein